MSTAELRAEVHRYVDEVDENLLKASLAMLSAYQESYDPVIGYDTEGNPLYASVAKEQFKARVEASKRGAYTTIEDLRKEAEGW